MKAGCELSEQMPECAGSTMKSDASKVVPALMREEAFGIVQPLDLAWTNVETDVNSLVPAPRLELGTP